MGQDQTFTDVQPIAQAQTFTDVQPITDPSSAIKQKYGLPDSADLSKGFLDPVNRDVKDPMAFSKAYSEANPDKPAPTGFLGNLAAEAKNIWKGMTAPPEMVPGTEAAIQRGQSVQDAAQSAKQGNVFDADFACCWDIASRWACN